MYKIPVTEREVFAASFVGFAKSGTRLPVGKLRLNWRRMPVFYRPARQSPPHGCRNSCGQFCRQLLCYLICHKGESPQFPPMYIDRNSGNRLSSRFDRRDWRPLQWPNCRFQECELRAFLRMDILWTCIPTKHQQPEFPIFVTEWNPPLPYKIQSIVCLRKPTSRLTGQTTETVSYTHLRAHETRHDLVCRLLLEKK